MFEEDKLTHKIIGCAMKVHSEIGCGFQEVIQVIKMILIHPVNQINPENPAFDK